MFFPVPVHVQCERFLLKPYSPFFPVPVQCESLCIILVLVPVQIPVQDQASMNTPLKYRERLFKIYFHTQRCHLAEQVLLLLDLTQDTCSFVIIQNKTYFWPVRLFSSSIILRKVSEVFSNPSSSGLKHRTR